MQILYLRLIIFLLFCLEVNLEEQKEIQELDLQSFKNLLLESNENWIIEFYESENINCLNFIEEYEDFAKRIKGIAKVGKMKKTTNIEQKFNIKEYPTLIIFGKDKTKFDKYKGEMKAKSIERFILKYFNFNYENANSKPTTNITLDKDKKKRKIIDKDEYEGHVVVLTGYNFMKYVNNSKAIWFIEFYAPWCEHCKHLQPEWEAAAKDMKNKVHFGKVDATEELNLAYRYEIQGYPTIKIFIPGNPVTNPKNYEGNRTKEDLVKVAQNEIEKITPSIIIHEIVSQEIFENECKEYYGTCLILVFPRLIDSTAILYNKYLKLFSTIADYYREEWFKFLWFQKGDQPIFESSLNIEGYKQGLLVIDNINQKFGFQNISFSIKSFKEFVNNFLFLSNQANLIDLPKSIEIKDAKKWDGKDYIKIGNDEL